MDNAQRVARRRRKIFTWIGVIVILIGFGAWFGWYKFFREEPQPDWVFANADMRFKYGSIGAEFDAGVPYWIFYVMPRIFPEKLPGSGGLASLGAAWEQGQELPVGFTKKTIGFPRVANNCAVCHMVSYRTKINENPTFVTAGPGHTNVEAYFRYIVDCAKDPRFNADNLMREINLVTDLSFVDRAIYRFLLIPITKKRLLEREQQFKWIYRADFPDWGRGRDDAMNLTKYFMIKVPMDDTFGPTDMPSIWNLKKYHPEKGHTLNWAGDSHDPRSVVIDSALGLLGAAPHDKQDFLGQVQWLLDYLGAKQAPKFPFPVDEKKAAQGKAVFDQVCAVVPRQREDRYAIAVVCGEYGPRPTGFVEQGSGDRSEQSCHFDGHRAQGSSRGDAGRIQRRIPRWHLAARAVSAQRFGADTARHAQARGRASQGVLARLRPVRPGRCRLRIAGARSTAYRYALGCDHQERQQRRPRVRHRSAGEGQGRAGGVSQDDLKGMREGGNRYSGTRE